MEAELILKNDTHLGEGPVWDHRNNTLYWVDILKGYVQAYDYQLGSNRIYKMGEFTGAVVPTTDGSLIVALQNKIVLLDPLNGQTKPFCEPEPEFTSNRFNDGKCDPKGRFWIGSTQIDHQDPTGVLYCVNQDSSFIPKLHGLLISNGLAWSPDGTTMYFIDSPTKKVQAFHFDQESSNIQYQRDVLVLDNEQGVPDGMSIDSEGQLWIAFYGGGKVGCYHPMTGKLLDKVSVPAKNTTSCCFGGPDLGTLFITTAKRDDPNGGGLYSCRPGVLGLQANFFDI